MCAHPSVSTTICVFPCTVFWMSDYFATMDREREKDAENPQHRTNTRIPAPKYAVECTVAVGRLLYLEPSERERERERERGEVEREPDCIPSG